MFHMANDSGLFKNAPGKGLLPLYEGKMIQQFDHRFASFEALEDEERMHMLPKTSSEVHQDPSYTVRPCYYVARACVDAKLANVSDREWLVGFREVTSSGLARTVIFSILPRVAVGNKVPLVFLRNAPATHYVAAFLANANSLVLDYLARQKIGGATMSLFIVKQLPLLDPVAYRERDLLFLVPRVLELVYTAWDVKAFADDVWRDVQAKEKNYHVLLRQIQHQWESNRAATGGHDGRPPIGEKTVENSIPLTPFKWDEQRRSVLRAELDAYFAYLYGLSERELRYILDPEDVHGHDFPGETFRVLKEREIKNLGEYRTRRLVLGAWERLDKAVRA